MKVSLAWLQTYFDAPLPTQQEIAHALTFHAFEIEEEGEGWLDVKVLPDRAAYALSHRGVARELSAILNIPLKHDPLREAVTPLTSTDMLTVSVENPEKCLRYMGAVVKGVSVGPSPAWLKEALESVGQRSINNVVDVTNYVMLDLGQPLHAFDAGKLAENEKGYVIEVRGSREGERIATLTGDEYALPNDTLLITDGVTSIPVGIAGVKGGKAAEVDTATTDLVIEAACFDGATIRRASQALKLWTDASTRFQNKPSPELVAYGMNAVLSLLKEVAGGEVVGGVDMYPMQPEVRTVATTLARINGRLGSSFTHDEVKGVVDRLGMNVAEEGDVLTVTPPFERRDIVIPDDLAEEVGRILGYDRIESAELPENTQTEGDRFKGIERIKDLLTERGFTEVSTQSFAAEGDIVLANPLQSDRPALRARLAPNMQDALARAKAVAPRVLGPEDSLKLFELGSVFTREGEHLSLALGYVQLVGKQNPTVLADMVDTLATDLGLSCPVTKEGDQVVELDLTDVDFAALGTGYAPSRVSLGAYRPFSVYPFALRDVAVWTPEGTEDTEVSSAIVGAAGNLLARIDLFDRFDKDGRTSYAFRLVFESCDRTLADADIDPVMESVTGELNSHEGWQVR